jgi:hypothetical protein
MREKLTLRNLSAGDFHGKVTRYFAWIYGWEQGNIMLFVGKSYLFGGK